MTEYQNSLCNSQVCSHPSCWDYHRRVLKNQVGLDITNSDANKAQKAQLIEVPHQTIINANDCLSTPDRATHNQQKNSAILHYLLSRKKAGPGKLKRDSNHSNRTKLAKLNVHEVFEEEELKSDWRSTFKAKDVYVWIPGNNGGSKRGQNVHYRRSKKTPTMQLAPVNDYSSPSRIQSAFSFPENTTRQSRMDTDLSLDPLFGIDKTNSSMKTQQKIPSVRKSPRIQKQKTNNKSNNEEKQKFDELLQTLNNQKMEIHMANDKSNGPKSDFYCAEPTFRLDPRPTDNSFYFFPSRVPLTKSSQFSESTQNSISSLYGLSRPAALKLRKIGAIDEDDIDNFAQLRLGPHRTPNSLNSSARSNMSSRSSNSRCLNSAHNSIISHSNTENSLQINALSTRSTLADDDLLPGNSVIKMLQQSYELMRERSEQLEEEDNKEYTTNETLENNVDLTIPQLEPRQKQLMLQQYPASNIKDHKPQNSPLNTLSIHGNKPSVSLDRTNIQSAPAIQRNPPIKTQDPISQEVINITSAVCESPSAPPPSPDLKVTINRIVSAAPDLYTVRDDEDNNSIE